MFTESEMDQVELAAENEYSCDSYMDEVLSEPKVAKSVRNDNSANPSEVVFSDPGREEEIRKELGPRPPVERSIAPEDLTSILEDFGPQKGKVCGVFIATAVTQQYEQGGFRQVERYIEKCNGILNKRSTLSLKVTLGSEKDLELVKKVAQAEGLTAPDAVAVVRCFDKGKPVGTTHYIILRTPK